MSSIPESLAKKLTILKYPKPQYINLEEREEFINVTIYLLETYLPSSSKSESSDSNLDLQLITVSDSWEDSLKKYLESNYCTLKIDNLLNLQQKQQVLEWLAIKAIKSSYKENADQIHETKYKCLQKLKLQLLNIDSSPEDLKAAVTKMAQLFNIPIGDNLTQMLHAIVRIAERKFTPDIVNKQIVNSPTTPATTSTTSTNTNDNSNNNNSTSESVNNNIFPLGFDLHNEKMNSVATILRLLYVSDLREIQSKINQVLAIVQNYSADPQTNFKLGVVGR